MKKIISMILCAVISLSVLISASAVSFSDLENAHWAYNNIMTLVNEGTINGYEDGTFKPSKTVTRAEFVKMIGKWDKKIAGSFSDLSANHWGYEYLIWSGLTAEDGKMYPDREMLRSEIINLIWKRNGSPKNSDAPSAITSQGTNKDATSWGYTIGLIQGSDGLHLNLDKPVTRAEAATLIVRSRQVVSENKKLSFKDVVSKDVLTQVFNTTKLFSKELKFDDTITYGELSRAALILGATGESINYDNSSVDTYDLFEHEYTKDFYALCNIVWGKENYTKEKIDAPVTMQDAVSGLMHGYMRRGAKPLNVGTSNGYYPDCVDAKSTVLENMYLTAANYAGIKAVAGNNILAQETATMQDILVLLLSMDASYGLEICYVDDAKTNIKTNLDLSYYPQNYKDYRALIEGVPGSLYNIKDANTKPYKYYKMANDLSFVYTTFLGEVRTHIQNSDSVLLSFTYYPSLYYSENGKTIFVAKAVVTKAPQDTLSVKLDTIFADLLVSPSGLEVTPGEEFFVVFETKDSSLNIYLPYSDASITSIVIPD